MIDCLGNFVKWLLYTTLLINMTENFELVVEPYIMIIRIIGFFQFYANYKRCVNMRWKLQLKNNFYF